MKCWIGLILMLGVAMPAFAQGDGPVPDTLDWHGYMPLAIGNQWQYDWEEYGFIGTLDRWIEQWTVIGDTTIGARSYFVVETQCDSIYSAVPRPFGFYGNPCDETVVEIDFLRYDEERANVMRRVEEDGVVEERPWWWESWWEDGFRLDAAFGVQEGPFYYEWDDRARIDEEWIDTTVKRVGVESAVPGGFVFAHGIGFVSSVFGEGGAGTSQRLIFARVGERTYGTAWPVAAAAPEQPPSSTLTVYPNPFRDRLIVHATLPHPGPVTLRLVDALGREVVRQDLGVRPAGALVVDLPSVRLAAGVYGLVVTVGGRVVAREAVVRVR